MLEEESRSVSPSSFGPVRALRDICVMAALPVTLFHLRSPFSGRVFHRNSTEGRQLQSFLVSIHSLWWTDVVSLVGWWNVTVRPFLHPPLSWLLADWLLQTLSTWSLGYFVDSTLVIIPGLSVLFWRSVCWLLLGCTSVFRGTHRFMAQRRMITFVPVGNRRSCGARKVALPKCLLGLGDGRGGGNSSRQRVPQLFWLWRSTKAQRGKTSSAWFLLHLLSLHPLIGSDPFK